MRAQAATIENGFVHLPTSAPWLADFLHELTVFPNGPPRRPGRFHRAGDRLDQAAVIHNRNAGKASCPDGNQGRKWVASITSASQPFRGLSPTTLLKRPGV
jgi:hypothetical protein